MQRKGLGKGLSDLISADALKQGATLLELRPHEIEPNPFQPRTSIGDEELEDLTRSVERHGVVQPLVVRPAGNGYQLVTGERRWRAAQRAGLSTVPCLVRDTNDAETLQIALVENLQREDLNPMDAAKGYQQLIDKFESTQEQVAAIVGRSRSAVANTLRLLDLPNDVQAAVKAGTLTEGHARALLGLGKDDEKIRSAASEVTTQQLTVRETEEYVRARTHPGAVERDKGPQGRTKVSSTVDPNLTELEERLQRALGTKVRLRPRKRGGAIQIVYHDSEDLDRIITLLDPPSSRYGEFE